ncbi:amidase [Celeribacter sp. PS-C1]|uniref:amidase n=1 Tax=Celeribacter sp. PS-C1 TaxID=2820813 RepID=UPI001CA4CCA7|nr:amidase [Celeribacter sp. PS-C1]MBW6417631.1 amidase [Celeribacter sp. PS-C1]
MSDLIKLDATDLIAKVSSGTVKHRDVAEAYLERIAEKDGAIGAYIHTDPDLVRKSADARDKAEAGPLAGLPVGVKDVIDTVDMPTGYGSEAYAGRQPYWDAPCVAQSKAAGALIMGKTVSTEFAMASSGKTRNPWNLAHTPGGSSSGSCAAVAAGLALMAFGTQTAGSIIRPASFCGVVGYKPTFGLLEPAEVKVLAHSLDTLGLVTRNVRDAALAASVLAGRPSLKLPEDLPAAPKIGLFRTPPFDSADPATVAALDLAVQRIEAAGGSVVEIDVPESFITTHALHLAIMGWEVTRALSFERTVLWDQLTPVTRDFLTEKALVDAPAYDAACAALPKVAAELAEAMTDVDVLLAPSAPGTAPEGFASTGAPMFNTPWTLLHMPALSVPAIVHDGLPVGVQVIGRVGEDAKTLAMAAFVETCLDAPRELQ